MCWCTLKLYNLILCVMLNSFYMTWLGLPLNYHLMSLVRTIPPPNRELTRLIYGTVEQHESYLQMCDATNHHVIPNWKFQSHRSFQNFLSFQDWCKCKLIPALKFSADFQQNPILQKLPFANFIALAILTVLRGIKKGFYNFHQQTSPQSHNSNTTGRKSVCSVIT